MHPWWQLLKQTLYDEKELLSDAFYLIFEGMNVLENVFINLNNFS